MTYDVIVLGLGAMGSSAALCLAQRGKRVLGIEQFVAAHDKGSSHGGSRMIRQAYWESPAYIPLVLRAYELWEKLEQDSGARLLNITGGLILGSADGALVTRGIAAADAYAIPYAVLTGAEICKRFPVITPLPGDVAVVEERAGYLFPEECIRAQVKLAARNGAELHFEENVLNWNSDRDRAVVTTERGVYEAEHLVIAAGAWAPNALHGIFPLRVTRQVMHWIRPAGGIGPFLPGVFPVFLNESLEDGLPTYGFPAIDGPSYGIKAAIHGSDEQCTPQTIDRGIRPGDEADLISKLRPRFPSLAGQFVKAQTCMYTMTPDEHFVIGLHPRFSNVSVACGFSGHGFKFASVVGEILADLAYRGNTSYPIEIFSPQRFTTK
ncbi:MAG TPA: N-methyl-L-tryptophan oxidase [Terracidiphilus sp.]|jgi:sarcosine oxidase